MSWGEAIIVTLALLIPFSFIMAILDCEAEERKRKREHAERVRLQRLGSGS